ncbi:SGNH/GDSL hydrolase family protein [Eisenbergiella sp.]|uniref:SGNH/GDSL hydrolase family protein n=1 Tax=Eisenbergiella sp. TaxID=1924109 RepID=UPI00208B1C01|nr:SGNH/GDSL hydrolase family protein [Eisenbergiella sp.]BDF44268.1 hypothetical protein CE91St56_13910 [Lachnospiraceae bacterium]GKH40333.1 hypothetical protein CE91St57_13070 [Lachnospiraceae bacterium]
MKRMNKQWKRQFLALALCVSSLFTLNVNAAKPQADTVDAAGKTQTETVQQTEAAGDIWQQQAELEAANAEAYRKAQEEFAAQQAAYQQALLEQQARVQQETREQQEREEAAAQAALQQSLTEAALAAQQEQEAAARQAADLAARQAQAEAAAAQAAQSLQTLPQDGTIANGRLIAAGLLSAPIDSPLKGKSLSILGDSISTYQGYIPSGYACFYPESGNDVKEVTQTWWMQVLYNTGMRLAVNGSYSASSVCGDSQAEDSSAGCSDRRIKELAGADGMPPDVILVYLGANDFFRCMDLGKFEGITGRGEKYYTNFTEAYERMIQKLLNTYPTSRIYCMTLIEANSGDHPRINEKGNTIADFNGRIKEIAAAYGLPVIDVHNCGMEVYELNHYTSDGTHPNKEGAAKMANYVTAMLLQTA